MQSAVRTLLLLAATLVLGLSPLGFITVPGFGGAITFLHIPMLLAATLESPLAAGILGAAFGIFAGLRFDELPLVYHVVVRTTAGVIAAMTFQAISSSASEGSKVTVASAVTAVIGTFTNTFLMCMVVFSLHLADPGTLISVALVHGAVEMAAAILIIPPLTIALKSSKS